MIQLSYTSLSVSYLVGDFTHTQSFSWIVWVVLHVGMVLLICVSVALALCRRRLMESEYELSQVRAEMERIEELMVDKQEVESAVVSDNAANVEEHNDTAIVVEDVVEAEGEIVEMYVDSSMTASDRLFLTRLIQYVEKNIDRADLAVSKLCDFMGVTPLVLNKKLKSLVGVTAIAFIRNIRLHRAAILLRTSRYTVADVTYDVGFSDLRYFRECFKKEFGVLPQEYKAGGDRS